MNKNAELLLPMALAHEKADEYVKGTYSKDGQTFRGCSVGCSINDATILGLLTCKTDNHAELAKLLFNGVEQIVRLQDAIFEGLPKNLAHAWTPRLLQAVIDAPENINYQRAWHLFAYWLLVDHVYGVIKYAENPEIVQRVAALHMRAAIDERVADNEWKDAKAAASAARDARDARDLGATWDAISATIRAAVLDAAEAAMVAVWAARVAAVAAVEAAAAPEDARTAAYERMADKLIELIKKGTV